MTLDEGYVTKYPSWGEGSGLVKVSVDIFPQIFKALFLPFVPFREENLSVILFLYGQLYWKNKMARHIGVVCEGMGVNRDILPNATWGKEDWNCAKKCHVFYKWSIGNTSWRHLEHFPIHMFDQLSIGATTVIKCISLQFLRSQIESKQ